MEKKALIVIDEGFEDMEAMYPFYRLQEAGLSVTVAAGKKGLFHGKHGYPLRAEVAAEEVDITDYKALVIPGGHAPDRMRILPALVEIARRAVDEGLVVGAICHGPQLLIEADVLKGRRATCYISVKTDLINAGALYEDSPAVVDGNLITSRHPADLPQFCRAVIEVLS